MSSTGQIVGAIGGGVLGFFLAGPAGAIKGAAYGAALGGYIDPPPGPNLRGPTLDDRSFQSTAYGVSIARLYGTIATMGNIIYLENNEYKAVSKKESQGGKGGGGGTYETTTYFATFAVALGEAMPGSAIRRLWAGGKLIYSANADDMDSVLQSGANQKNWRYYDGTQEFPDSRMEAALGVGNCPSYEGTAYIIFHDFELVEYGNGLSGCPIKAEIIAVNDGSEFTPHFLRTYDTPKLEYSQGASGIFYNGNFYCIPRLKFGGFPDRSSGTSYSGPVTGGGIVYGTESLLRSDEFEPAHEVIMVHGVNTRSRGWYSYFWGTEDARFFVYSADVGEISFAFGSEWSTQVIGHVVHVAGGLGFSYSRRDDSTPVQYFIVCNGDHYLPVAHYAGFGFSDSGLLCVVNGNSVATGTISRNITLYAVSAVFPVIKSFSVNLPKIDANNAVFLIGDFIYIFDVPNAEGVGYWIIDHISEEIRATGFVEFNLDYFSPDGPRSLMWGYENGVFCVSCLLNDSLDPNSKGARFVYFTISGASSVSAVHAPTIVESVTSFCGIDSINTDEIEGEYVDGYAVSTITSGRAMLKPIQVALLFDLVELGYTLHCLKRNDVAIATVPYEHIIPGSDGKIVSTEITQEAQLPSRYTLNYIEYNREYDTGSESAPYPSLHENNRTEELPVVLSTSRAAQLADILCRLSWIERYSYSFQLPQAYLNLRAGDVINLDLGQGRSRLIRIESTEKSADQIISITARSASFGAYSSSATGTALPAPSENIQFIGNSRGFLLDIPMIQELQNTYGIVAAVSGDGSWPGGVLMGSSDNGQTFTTLTSFYSMGTIASTQDVLPEDDGLVADRSSTLAVSPFSGEFFSITEAQMMTGKNYCAYGSAGRWEIIQYATAQPNSDGTVNLSIFLRGLFGTEWATGLHQTGDTIVFLDDPDNQFVGLPAGALNLQRQYKTVTVGKDPAASSQINLIYKGVNLKPLSVVNVSGGKNLDNDWIVNFFARTRYQSGFWVAGVQPQNEPQLQFEIDVLNGAAIVRTINVSVVNFTYTESQQIEDFGAVQSTINIVIYQISAAVGRGYPRDVTL